MARSATPLPPPLTAGAGMRAGWLISAALLAVAVTACGGAAKGSTTSATNETDATHSETTSSTPSAEAVTSGPVRGAVSGQNHAPKVGEAWRYSLTVTDAAGHPLSGAVDVEFAFAGQVVGHDSPPTHPVKHGHWTDKLTFPAAAVGHPLSLQAVVHTPRGSITLDWPITVRR